MREIPEWLARMPKNAGVGVKEISTILGISMDAVRDRARNGYVEFPKPDFRAGFGCRKEDNLFNVNNNFRGGKAKHQWKAVTVRNYIRKLNRMELGKSK